MRFIRNEIQTPQYLVPQEKRKSFAFYLLIAGIVVLVIGTTAFFGASFFRESVEQRWNMPFRNMQTYALAVGGGGIMIYIISALMLKIPLRKTTYDKINSIVKNKPYDPPRKGDYTKAIYLRLRDLSDEWSLTAEVCPPESDFVIPQVVIGPPGMFAIYPVNENPERKTFKDPGAGLERAGKKLGSAVGQQVIPVIVFATPKLIEMYKRAHETKTRLMHVLEIENNFGKRKKKLSADQIEVIESKVFDMIKGTAPGA